MLRSEKKIVLHAKEIQLRLDFTRFLQELKVISSICVARWRRVVLCRCVAKERKRGVFCVAL